MSELAPMGDALSVPGDADALRSNRLRSAEVRNAAMSAGLAFAAAGGAFAFGAPGAAAAHALLALALPLAALVGLEGNGFISSRRRKERGLAPRPMTWRASLLLTAGAVLVVVASGVGERSGVPLLLLASLCVTAFMLWPLRTGTSRPLLITLAFVACLALLGHFSTLAPLAATASCLGLAAWSDRRYRDAERRLAECAGGASVDAFEVRLAELSRLTEQYAGFSEYGVGLGGVPLGLCWLGAGTALTLGAHRLAQVCLALAAPVLALGLRAARRFYQRHGVVRGPTEMGGSAPMHRLLALLLAIAIIVRLTVAIAAQPLDPTALSSLHLAAVWGACLALAAALAWGDRARPHQLVLGTVAAISAGSVVPPWGAHDLGSLLFFGALWVTVSLLAHLRYWRLERRLAALRRTMS